MQPTSEELLALSWLSRARVSGGGQAGLQRAGVVIETDSPNSPHSL